MEASEASVMRNKHQVRSVFLSDLHLGARSCQAERLLSFLNHIDPEQVFLIGDVVDLWSLKRRTYWPASHQAVFAKLLSLSKEGRRVVLIPGNHDADLREFSSLQFGGVEIHRSFVFHASEGRRLLLLHGDEFDAQLQCPPWLETLGSQAYDLTLAVDWCVAGMQRRMGLDHWSFANYIKQRLSRVQQHVRAFEHAVVREARQRRVDGVICGHIHRPALRQIEGLLYGNDGDWVENCTSIVERLDGKLELWHWHRHDLPAKRATLSVLPELELAA